MTLRGTEGGEQVEVDAHGRVLRTLQTVDPQPGTQVTLTLDLDIQHAAEEALRGHMGAAVALDPATGDILAMASAPAYDPEPDVRPYLAAAVRLAAGPATPGAQPRHLRPVSARLGLQNHHRGHRAGKRARARPAPLSIATAPIMAFAVGNTAAMAGLTSPAPSRNPAMSPS